MVSYKYLVTNKNFNKWIKGSTFDNEHNLVVLHQEQITSEQKQFGVHYINFNIHVHVPRKEGTYFDLALCQSSAIINLPKLLLSLISDIYSEQLGFSQKFC